MKQNNVCRCGETKKNYWFQDYIDGMVETWNCHLIRPSRNKRSPSGRPNVMYRLPSLYSSQDYMCPVPENEVELCENECIFREAIPCDPDAFQLLTMIVAQQNLSYPLNATQAIELYIKLRQEARTGIGI